MKLLVTGCSGFVGRNLCLKLVKAGHEVIGFDIQESSELKNLNNFSFHNVNLCDEDALNSLLTSNPEIDVVFHTIAVQPTKKDDDLLKYFNINTGGAANLLVSMKKHGLNKIVVSSSFSVYGKPTSVPVPETHQRQPENIYGVSKLMAEELFEYYARKENFKTIILRYDGIYGKNQTIPGVLNYLMSCFSENEKVELFNKGEQVRDQVYVGDVVDSNLLALEKITKSKEETMLKFYNIGGADKKTSAQLAESLKSAMNSDSEIILSDKGNRLMAYDSYMDMSLSKSELGYDPKPFTENIKEILA